MAIGASKETSWSATEFLDTKWTPIVPIRNQQVAGSIPAWLQYLQQFAGRVALLDRADVRNYRLHFLAI
jgi:hypothetical protein